MIMHAKYGFCERKRNVFLIHSTCHSLQKKEILNGISTLYNHVLHYALAILNC